MAVVDVVSKFLACPPEQAARAGGALAIRLPILDLVLKPVALTPAAAGAGAAGAGAGAAAQQPHTAIDVTIEVMVRDAAGGTRRLRASTATTAPRVTPFLASLPLVLEPAPGSHGWCRVRLDVAAIVATAYPDRPAFAQVDRLRIHAPVRLRCVYFADRPYAEGELPPEFRLVVGVKKKKGEGDAGSAGVAAAAAATETAAAATEAVGPPPPSSSPVACT